MKKQGLLFNLILGTAIVSFLGCEKTNDSSQTDLAITTSAITSVSTVSAKSGGAIANDGGSAITARGICWSTNETPTIGDNKTTDGTGTGSFASLLTGLTANTSYYLRAYATTSKGTTYGDRLTFKTNHTSLVGTWGGYSSTTTVLITFFDNSHFEFVQISGNVPKGNHGVEIGSYTWNPLTGAFAPTIEIGTDEDWGFHGTPPSLFVNSDTLCLIDDQTRKVPKIYSATNPLIGSWGGRNPNNNSVIYVTFIDDSHWVFAQGGPNVNLSGIQIGTYTWNSTTGAFTGEYIFEPFPPHQAEWGGLELESFNNMKIQNDTLVLSLDGVVWRSIPRIK